MASKVRNLSFCRAIRPVATIQLTDLLTPRCKIILSQLYCLCPHTLNDSPLQEPIQDNFSTASISDTDRPTVTKIDEIIADMKLTKSEQKEIAKRQEEIKVKCMGSDFSVVANPKGKFKRKARGKFRGSKYRGVSKNGKQWQVFIMIGRKKRYIGVVGTEEDAAKLYDQLAIYNHGSRAKTNFSYKKSDILEILNLN